jgi:hypothetical protein
VKKVMCYVLIVWLALVSGGANAHTFDVTDHETHGEKSHAEKSTAESPPAEHLAQTGMADAHPSVNSEAGHTEACAQAHCGHGHTTCMLAVQDAHIGKNASERLPPHTAGSKTSEVSNDIERPKWLDTPPTVVSLLS